jgi:hypothetical protein
LDVEGRDEHDLWSVGDHRFMRLGRMRAFSILSDQSQPKSYAGGQPG